MDNLSPSSVVPSGGSTFQFVDVFGSTKKSKKVNKGNLLSTGPNVMLFHQKQRGPRRLDMMQFTGPNTASSFLWTLAVETKIHPWTNSLPIQFVKLVANSICQTHPPPHPTHPPPHLTHPPTTPPHPPTHPPTHHP